MVPPGSSASLAHWLQWLEKLSPYEIELGLDRISRVLERLALPRPSRVLTVGGTNGKGSAVAMLEALLKTGGIRIGSYTSPHVLHYCERIRIGGKPVSEASIVATFERIERVRDGVPLTYFEYGTLAALSVFAAHGVDSVVLEVGLGGRLDAVNAVDADACLITNVSLDHCDWLGRDVESIGAEKAGIMRAGRPVVFGSPDPPRSIETAAARKGAELIVAGREFSRSDLRDGIWDWTGRGHSVSGLAAPGLRGEHQLDNASAVFALLEASGLKSLLQRECIDEALSPLGLPGRLQRIEARGLRWLLDGAHNPAGALALGDALPELAGPGRVFALLGVLDDKDSDSIIRALAPVVDRWVACSPDSPRAIPGDHLARQIAAAAGQPCRNAGSVEAAMQAAEADATGDDLILVAGSFYTVGQALRYLGSEDSGS